MNIVEELNSLIENDEFNQLKELKRQVKNKLIDEFSLNVEKTDLQMIFKDYCFALIVRVDKIIKQLDELEDLLIQYNYNKDENLLIKINDLKDRIEEYIEQNS